MSKFYGRFFKCKRSFQEAATSEVFGSAHYVGCEKLDLNYLAFLGWTNKPFLHPTDKHLLTNSLVDKWIDQNHYSLEDFNKYRRTDPDMRALWKDFAKYDKPEPDYDQGAWRKAEQFLYQHFFRYCCNSRILGDEVVDTWERKSSAGFPWNMYFSNTEEFLVFFREKLPVFYDEFMAGGDLCPVWNVSPKTEVRSWEKNTTEKNSFFHG